MTEERKRDLFNEMINYLCGVTPDKCIEILKKLRVTRSEAEDLEFFDFITSELPEAYGNPEGADQDKREALTNVRSLRRIGVQFDGVDDDDIEGTVTYYFNAPKTFLDEYTTVDAPEAECCEMSLEVKVGSEEFIEFEITPIRTNEDGEPEYYAWQTIQATKESCKAFLTLAIEDLEDACS